MNSLLSDLHLVLRQMRRSPGFALTAVLTLALGIAANVIVFGVLQGLLLRPLDVPHGDRVMTLARTDQTYPIFSYPEVKDVRDGSTAFSSVAAWGMANYGVEADGAARPVWGYEVSGQYFEVVGIKPLMGRLLQRADDDHPGASNAAVLSYVGWKTYFGGDAAVVGKTVRLNKQPYTIVGVTPEGFFGTEKFAQPFLFVPLANRVSLGGATSLESRSTHSIWAIVRVKDGVTMAQAKAELDAIAARTTRQYPKDEEKLGFKLTEPGMMGDFIGAPARAFMAGVMGLALIVLLAACANLGGLFAARTADRTREIAIRLAVGSSRWRVVRQILMEALLIALIGGLCACGLGWAAVSALANWHPPTEYPMSLHILPQPSLIAIGLLISVLAGVVFGVVPLRQIFKTDPNEAIKSGGKSSGGGRRWALRDVLLAVQIALCCVTVTAAFVSLRGLEKTLTMDMGFNPRHAVMTKYELAEAGYTDDKVRQFQRLLRDRVAQLPGVQAVAYADRTPLSQDTATIGVYTPETTDFKAGKESFYAYRYDVSPGYFAAADTTLLAGRDLSSADTATTPLVAVVNKAFVEKFFHLDDGHATQAVGRSFKNAAGVLVQIVGIVADGKYFTVSEDQDYAAFVPIAQHPGTSTTLLVRMRPDAPESATDEMAGTVRKVIQDMDSSIPVRASGRWIDQLGLAFLITQVATTALGLFGAFGLLLSITGTFGLASYTVSKRMRELSIRVALGAQAKQILSAAMGRMLILLASGSVVGLILGAAASHLLSAIVYQASAHDPMVLGAVAATMILTGSLAVAGPVRRALRVDPSSLLREE
jgi:predicted permease